MMYNFLLIQSTPLKNVIEVLVSRMQTQHHTTMMPPVLFISKVLGPMGTNFKQCTSIQCISRGKNHFNSVRDFSFFKGIYDLV